MKQKKEKKITVKVKNKQLDTLEDLLFAELTDEETTRKKEQVKKLWAALVKAYDKKNDKRPG